MTHAWQHRRPSAPQIRGLPVPAQIIKAEKTGFFCSSQCPGLVIQKTFKLITAMRDEGRILIGGFRVPARSIVGMHLKPELHPAFVELTAPHVGPLEECVVEWESPSGSKMRIQWKTAAAPDWVSLLRAWRETEA
jgi:hypothetical protein